VDEVISTFTRASWPLVAILVKGGLVMVPLLASSVLSLAVIIERWLFWRRCKQYDGGETVLSLVAAGRMAQAVAEARGSQHPVARVLLAGLEHQDLMPGMAMEATAQTEVYRLKRYLPLLDTIITLAPLLGLLGTITGMINAFGIVSEAGLGQPNAITGGVAEALIATAMGLLIAIMTLVPYNYFRVKADATTSLMEARATRLELILTECRAQEEK
jgi:biopolymer transport protein ExbB